jgi:hypothetical protein
LYVDVDYEDLSVEKTAYGHFTREHMWSVDKDVIPDHIYLYTNGDIKEVIDGYLPTEGDGVAEWTVIVTYGGPNDKDFYVEGYITIKNTGTLTAKITKINDYIGLLNPDEELYEYWVNDVSYLGGFPITLNAGEDGDGDVLKVYYRFATQEEGIFDLENDMNKVDVYTERFDFPDGNDYNGESNIVWEMEDEIDETVELIDAFDDSYDTFEWKTGDPLYEEDTIPDDQSGPTHIYIDASTYEPYDENEDNTATFTYTHKFEHGDFEEYGTYTYKNTAEIYGLDSEKLLDDAEADLYVHIQRYIYETAFGLGDDTIEVVPFYPDYFDRWGWTNPISTDPGSYVFDLWAGAGQCDTDKGTLVGTVEVEYEWVLVI